MERKLVPLINLLAAAAFALAGLAACAATPAAPAPPDVIRLQSDLMALADTALARVTAASAPGVLDKDPNVRQFSHVTRTALGSSLMAIVSGPDPVDALLDMLTHTALVAEAARNTAEGKASDSVEANVLRALEQNEADAWRLAERWMDPAARSALRERIRSWPGQRLHPGAVSYVRLSDIPRTGSASAVAVEGMLDSLRAAVRQAEQARLLGERSLWLAQRMPFALRWQAETFAHNALTMEESRRLLEQIGGLTVVAETAVREMAGMPAQLTREREATLQDLAARIERERAATLRDAFARIERERIATIESIAAIVERERTATLTDAGAFIDAQRKAIFEEVRRMGGSAEERGVHWAGIGLLVGLVLVAALLMGSLGTGLLYRHLVRRREGRYPALSGTSPAAPARPPETGKS